MTAIQLETCSRAERVPFGKCINHPSIGYFYAEHFWGRVCQQSRSIEIKSLEDPLLVHKQLHHAAKNFRCSHRGVKDRSE